MKLIQRWCVAVCVVLCNHAGISAGSQSSLAEAGPSVEVNPSPITEKATCGDWASWVPPKTDPAIVMQAVSKRYADLERNFIRMMELNSAFTRQHLFLVCLDDASVAIFADLGIRCVPAGALPFRSHKDLWKTRVRVLSCLVEEGYNVIMSDADALWLGDPMDYMDLPGVTSSSIVASRDSFPKKIGHKWGTTICMGFILFRATGPGMDTFQDTMTRLVSETGDDQIAVNHAAFELDVAWDEDSDMHFTESTGAATGTIAGLSSHDGGPFTITLLPHNKFTRICSFSPVSDDTMVAHCFRKKNPEAKTDWMKELNFWHPEVSSP